MWKNVHPASSAGIQTHDPHNMSLLPFSLDQGSPSGLMLGRDQSVNFWKIDGQNVYLFYEGL